MADHSLDGLPALEPAALRVREGLVLAAMDGLCAGVVAFHAAQAQVHDDLPGLASRVLQQVHGLFELCRQDVPIEGIAGEASGAAPQARLVRHAARLTLTPNS
ncbi:MAG: hypothetical protein C0505_08630 [Leptothrix sp. (in: Bacteria)]|nr:hypothetical protein [Leptothrix sp. (in: b-proteobacteria)]